MCADSQQHRGVISLPLVGVSDAEIMPMAQTFRATGPEEATLPAGHTGVVQCSSYRGDDLYHPTLFGW